MASHVHNDKHHFSVRTWSYVVYWERPLEQAHWLQFAWKTHCLCTLDAMHLVWFFKWNLSIPEEGVLIFRSEEVYMRFVLEFKHQILIDTISLSSERETEQHSVSISFCILWIHARRPKLRMNTDLCYVCRQVLPSTTAQQQQKLNKKKTPFFDKV